MERFDAAGAYKETRIKTASPAALIVILYEEAIKHIEGAIAITQKDLKKDPSAIEKANAHILKAQEIVTELAASLNMDEGGEVAKSLMSLYTFFLAELSSANLEKKPDRLFPVRDMMKDLLSAWSEVASSASAAESPIQEARGVDIAG